MGVDALHWEVKTGKIPMALSPGHSASISDVEVGHDENAAGYCIINARAWDNIAQEFRFIDEGVLQEGAVIWPYVGYGSSSECLGRFVVARTKMSYSGVPTIRIEAYDALKRLVDCKKSRVYKMIVDDTIVMSSIAFEHGLIPSISPLPLEAIVSPRPVVKESGMSDLDFMKKFAKIYDYEPPQVKWVAGVGEVLQLRSRQDAVMQSPDEVMRYLPSSNSSMFGAEKAQIADLTIDDDTGDMPTSVEVVGYDADGQIVMVRADYSPIGVQVSTDYEWASQHEEAAGLVQDGVMLKLMAQGEGNSTLPSGGFSVVQGAGGSALMPADDTSTDVIHGSFVESSLTAQAYAASYFADKMSKFRVMNGSYGKLKGIEKIAVHNVYRLEGVAKKQRGKYLTTDVRHNLSRQNGHRVSFGARVVVASGTKMFSTFTV